MPAIIEDDDSLDELARLRALAGVQHALWELAINILDVARGHGKPLLLGPQAKTLLDTIDAHRYIAGCTPSTAELADVLNIASVPSVLSALQIAAGGLADYRSHRQVELEKELPTGYGTGYRPETQTTDFDA